MFFHVIDELEYTKKYASISLFGILVVYFWFLFDYITTLNIYCLVSIVLVLLCDQPCFSSLDSLISIQLF